MKKMFSAVVVLLVASQGFAQYYYNDIIGTQQTNQQYKMLVNHQLKKISATSFEQNNEPADGFLLDQSIDHNKQQVTTRSKTSINGESYFISTYLRNRLAKTIDSSNSAINSVQYNYDMNGRLLSTNSINKDFDGTLRSSELHQWFYNANGKPERMLRVKNGIDTTYVLFVLDDAGNVAEETWKNKNRTLDTYFYYYNDKNQLTDIVRYNRKAKQLLPDIILEYDEKGRVIQMTQTQNASANYLIWRYVYNDKGLKQKETVYNKQKDFLGRIEYAYQ